MLTALEILKRFSYKITDVHEGPGIVELLIYCFLYRDTNDLGYMLLYHINKISI